MYKSHKSAFDQLTLAKEDYEYEDHRGFDILKDIEDLRNDPFATIEAYDTDIISTAKLEEVSNYISSIETQKEQAIKEAKECILNFQKVKKAYEELLPMQVVRQV